MQQNIHGTSKIEDGCDVEDLFNEMSTPAVHIGSIDFDPTNNCIPSGFSDWDAGNYLRAGKSDLVILAARPSHGKTALALQLCANISRGGSAMFFSLEMDRRQLKQRLYSLESETPIGKLGLISENRKAYLDERFNSYNLYIDDTNGLDINTMMNRAMAFNKQKKLDIVAVDYIQIVNSGGGRSKSEEIGVVAEKLKTLSKELGCPVLALAQMSRAVESRQVHNKKESRPMMSDLADSSSLEKWSDCVIFMQRPFLINRERPGEVDFFVSKNRHGNVRDFTMGFSGELTKFFDKESEGL
jgi:replicative DNA helicase